MRHVPRVFVVVGGPGSGKDLLIRAVRVLGVGHVMIVPKHTSRNRRADDSDEMICPGDREWNLPGCDVVYDNYDDRYGIETERIWRGLRQGVFQVIVVSNPDAINTLLAVFGGLIRLVYVHSEVTADEYAEKETEYGDPAYIEKRKAKFTGAFESYIRNLTAFDHVFIHAGAPEDLYDQIFRLFRAYERGELR